MKKMFKKLVVYILAKQVNKLRQKNDFKIVAVVGGIGKTSTKFSIAHVLSGGLNVRYQKGNYNDISSVPLVFFGQDMPSLMNPLAWIKVFIKNQKQLSKKYPYDVVVVELGTDGVGQIKQFARYIEADITVVTALTPEHMEYFESMDAVAAEELSVTEFSKEILFNKDLCPQKYVGKLQNAQSYSAKNKADFYLTNIKNNGGYTTTFNGVSNFEVSANLVSETQLYSLVAATAVAQKLGVKEKDIQKQLKTLSAMPGRMNLLAGKNGSKIIDDSYNASPDAVKLALDTLMNFNAKKRIAVLGTMNELGEMSQSAHEEIGAYCDPKKIDQVVTIGEQAKKFLAVEAKNSGCKVESFDSPYDAGKFVALMLDKDTVVLVKGSQNRVFSEEAIKAMLANPADAEKLVRQSSYWMNVKSKQFKEV